MILQLQQKESFLVLSKLELAMADVNEMYTFVETMRINIGLNVHFWYMHC